VVSDKPALWLQNDGFYFSFTNDKSLDNIRFDAPFARQHSRLQGELTGISGSSRDRRQLDDLGQPALRSVDDGDLAAGALDDLARDGEA